MGPQECLARRVRDHHPDDALYRRGRRNGRPHRRDAQGENHSGRGQGRADAQARQEAVDTASAKAARRPAGRACRASAHARGRRQRNHLHLRHARRTHGHHRLAQGPQSRGNPVPRPAHDAKLVGRHLRRPGETKTMNLRAMRAIYLFEMARTGRTLLQSIVSPVVSTSLYFVVFGAAIGSRITEIDGVAYGAFIVPGLIMLMLLTQSVANASFGIYRPKFIGTIYELLSAPISYLEIVIGYVG